MALIKSNYDIVFLGGGISSNFIARYLKKKFPKLDILILEKNTKAHHNPGESTVGVTGLFMIRDLGLSTYCYLNHLPKNGLRFFFRDPKKSFHISELSEIGSNILPIIPTYQVDRAKLDEDLWRLNSELGVEVITGAEIQDVKLLPNLESHQLTFNVSDITYQISSKWVMNASGRGSRAAPVFDELSPIQKEENLQTAAAWGRFDNVVDIDSIGPENWRAKVGFTSRFLSTNHIMGYGYWIWIIPLSSGRVSIGVVYDKRIVKETIDTNTQFLEFIRKEPLIEKLLSKSKAIDFQSHPKVSFRRQTFCSPDRWVIIGDSMGFIDPLYSPGSDIIARQAHLIEHLINASSDSQLKEICALLNEYTQTEYDLIKLLYQNQYQAFESFEVFNIKSLWDFHSYTNRMVWDFLNKNYSDLDWIKREVATAPRTIELTKRIQNGFKDLHLYLKKQGLEHRMNSNQYSLRQNRFKIEEDMLLEYSNDRSVEEHLFLCRLSISELLESRFNIPDFREHRISQDMLTFACMSTFELTEEWFDKFLKRVSNRLSLMIKQKTSQKIDTNVTPEDYRKSVPECLSHLSQQVQYEAHNLWCECGYNPVLEQLCETVDKTTNFQTWKDSNLCRK